MRVLLLLALVLAGCLQPAPAPTTSPTAVLAPSPQATLVPAVPSVVFHTALGSFVLSVEIADSPEEHQRGLMNRTHLAADAGMLFVFPSEQPRYFWMRDTPLPLDMVFLSSAGSVVNLTQNATPCFEQVCPLYRSLTPARYVVEANAGYAQRIGLKLGDRVEIKAGSPGS